MLRKFLMLTVLVLLLAVVLPVSAAPPGAPVIASPGGGETYNTNLPFLQWTGDEAATSYRVIFRDTLGLLVHAKVFQAADVCTGTDCQASLQVDPPAPQFTFLNGTYTWRVIGINTDGRTRSAPATFSIDFPGAANPVFPANGAEVPVRNPSFIWDPSDAADQYRVVVRNLNTGVVRRSTWQNAAGICGATCTFTFDQQFPRSRYRWWVLARQVTFPQNISRSVKVPFRIVKPTLE